MALGTATRDAAKSGQGERVFIDSISFLGDDSYPTGGTTGFDGYVQSLLGDDRSVIAVVPGGDSGDHLPVYSDGNLMVRLISTGAEVANTTNLSGTTFNLVVISK